MRHNGLVYVLKGLGCIGLLWIGSTGFADGYRNPPATAAGIGKSGVNRVFVDDASAISYNPANLTLTDSGSILVDTTYAKTQNSYNNPINPAGSVDSKDAWVMLPNLYVSMPIGDNGVVAGLGITTPYGQGIEWNSGDLYNPFAPISLYKAEIALININPTIAFKLNDRISIGVGADIYYSELEFDGVTKDPATPPGPASGTAKAEGDDVAVGVNIGVTWQITESQRAILTYQNEVSLSYEGDFTATGAPFVDSSFGLEVTYPTIVAIGYGVELTDSIRIEANVEWLEWSANSVQTAELGANGNLNLPQNWDNTFTFGLGGDWQFAENWTLRSGYAFIETPIPSASLSPLLPDADRHVLSFGLGYTHGKHAIDLAYSFSYYKDSVSPAGAAASGDYDIDSDLVGMTYSFEF